MTLFAQRFITLPGFLVPIILVDKAAECENPVPHFVGVDVFGELHLVERLSSGVLAICIDELNYYWEVGC